MDNSYTYINRDITPWVITDGGALDVFSCPSCWEKDAHIQRYEFACNAFVGMRVLDFGCGAGYGSYLLSSTNSVLGVDSSVVALDLAKSRYCMQPDLEFSNEVGNQFFDGCTAFEVIEHLDNPEEFLRTVPARHLLTSVPVVPTVGRNPYHKQDFTIDSFTELMGRYFNIKWWWVQVRPFHHELYSAVFHGERKVND